MQPTLVFALVTVPDVAGLRRLHALPGELSDDEVVEFAYQRRRASGASDTLPPHQQRIVRIAGLLLNGDQLQHVVLEGEEASILQAFQELLKSVQVAVEWSCLAGGAVQSAQPILTCRALLLQLGCDSRPSFLDLAAVLASPLTPAELPLHEMALLARLPMFREMDQMAAWQAFQTGDSGCIETASDTRVLTIYLLWLRYSLQQGELDRPSCLTALASLRQMLQRSPAAHLRDYLADWSATAG